MIAPTCPHCGKLMTWHSKSEGGSETYFCACNGITWQTIHPEKEIPRVKRTYIPQGE